MIDSGIDWATLNMAALVAAIYACGRLPGLATMPPVADVLMANWAIGACLWGFGKAVPLAAWIANDVLAAAVLLLLVPGRPALLAGVIFLPIIAGNTAALVAGWNSDQFINAAGWVQLAVTAWGAWTDGSGRSGKSVDHHRGGVGARPAGGGRAVALSAEQKETG